MKYSRLLRPSLVALCCAVLVAVGALPGAPVRAAAVQNPQSGSIGVEGTIPTAPPSKAPTITTPRNGQNFTGIPITVAGLCTSGLLIKIFANNIFVGAAQCVNGSYSLQVDLFGGRNDLVARAFDALDQPSPDSNIVTVTFDDSQFNQTGNSGLLLTSNYAKRGANPGEVLTWPVILSGGAGPYALSVDWGDSKPPDLKSVQLPGTIDLSHIYDSAGVYTITVRATDKNGLIAYLQVIGVANGAITSNAPGKNNLPTCKAIIKVLWLPAALIMLLLPLAFWLGRRYELASLRKHLERHR